MRRPVWIAVAIVAVVVALVYWFWWRTPAPLAPEPAAVMAPPPAAPPPEPAPEVVVPALDGSDAFVKGVLGGLGISGPLAGALEQEEVARSFVAAVVAIARGQSPRRQLGFLEPEGYYEAAERDGSFWVDPASARRYDAAAAAIVALDARSVAAAYARSEALADAAYAEMGEEGPFRPVLLRAIDELLRAPVADLPVELVDTVASYEYAAAELEALSPAQKHLLRMGPPNQRAVQAWLAGLRSALGGG